MKITNIEFIPIYPRYAKRNHDKTDQYSGINHLAVFKVRTDNGLVGYCDCRMGPFELPPASIVEALIGRNPFDFINMGDFGYPRDLGAYARLVIDTGLGGALYDVMGKHLGVPAYKLMGQKLRDAISVAAWARPSAPEVFRAEILRAASEGYRIFKMHTTEYHDVWEQTRLAEEVAPVGFKIHYDFNGNRSLGAVLPIISELEKHHPIVGWIEDPLVSTDLDGWRTLRQKTSIPIIKHVQPLGPVQEALHGVADIYMLGERGGIGRTLADGFGLGALNIQVVMQLTGGTLAKALALHIASVLPTATGHSINLDDQYEDDIATKRIPVIEGFSPVPKGSGLGIEVDEDTLRRLAANKPAPIPRQVGILYLPNGHKFYTPSFPPRVSQLTGSEEGTIRGIRSELWEEDGTAEFKRTYERVQKQGAFLVGD